MAELQVTAGSGAYPVTIEAGLLGRVPGRLRSQAGASKMLVIGDSTTIPMFGRSLAEVLGASHWAVAAGESSKSWEALEEGCRQCLEAGLDRGSTVVAVGGGVVGDLAGVIAAIYLRGIRLVHVPTTLLAMVDSSIGGKAAIDLPEGKNLVGVFKPPDAVYIDPELLQSLPDREYRGGLAEVLKYSMIADEQLYDSLLANRRKMLEKDIDMLTDVVTTCCAIKAGVVSRDEKEVGERAILNYGHTFGHALEAATGYQRLTHGEAVAVGMAVAAEVGVGMGVTPADVSARQAELLSAYELPQSAPGLATVAETVGLIAHDKKNRDGATPWVLLDRLGHATIGHPVDAAVLERAASRVLGAGELG
jgi:3-dehydroquinate synthase